MPKPTSEEATSSPCSDLPLDLLQDISGRLCTATDYVRFHAVCQLWRYSLPPVSRRPAFLPWFLSPPDDNGHRTARCIFLSKSTGRASDTEVPVRNRRWVINTDNGTAALLVTDCTNSMSSSLVHNPLIGSAVPIPVPCDPDDANDNSREDAKPGAGIVSGDGTIFQYALDLDVGPYHERPTYTSRILHPGAMSWSFQGTCRLDWFRSDWCFAYHKGIIVECLGTKWYSMAATAADGTYMASQLHSRGRIEYEHNKYFLSSYLVESRGELLWVTLQVALTGEFHNALTVTVYGGLEEAGWSPCLRWKKRDGCCFDDRIFFLGWPTSFAVEATRYGTSAPGCAYFATVNIRSLGLAVYRYSFREGKSELVEQLPSEWRQCKYTDCMWLTPQPAIATTKEIRERAQVSNRKCYRASDETMLCDI